ncbi:glycogen-binding subunit 76A-like [Uloborus diversus]|uniref:glycogen-binding subunit 76A-like n=1 Tax=Uloborus diversus TaxID=327109 RepID=UPI002409011C|nr:glycogen-binding subunit 76A-like [Uloborus diversus]
MPVLGAGDHWAMSCSLNLASCRLRAEALARQLHSNLWSGPRSAQGSPGDSGCVSPCFGLPPTSVLGIVDRPPLKLEHHLRMSSLDDEEEQEQLVSDKGGRRRENGDLEICSSPTAISPPYSPFERIGLLPKDSATVYGNCKEETHVWRPDSPPESFASESEILSDSPALTIETEEPSSTTSNSTETVSELASPTYDYQDEGSPLADELRSRLKLIQSSQTSGIYVPSTKNGICEEKEESSQSSTLSSETTTSGRGFLSPPSPCPRLVRSTSLKTGKTPPGTPSRKKIVRFADVLGLDLEAIRHFVKDDDAPIVPQSAFADLRISASSSASTLLPWNVSSPSVTPTGCLFVPQFEQPGSDPHFLDIVRQKKVCLENAVISDLKVTGVIRVLNLGYEKRVQVRYTTTEWAAHTDLTADYIPSSCDGFSDKFSFNLNLPHLSPGQRLVFALRYIANGQEFWDNNNSENYVLKVQAKSLGTSTTTVVNGPRWLHHFM